MVCRIILYAVAIKRNTEIFTNLSEIFRSSDEIFQAWHSFKR